MTAKAYTFEFAENETRLVLKGRDAWALELLIARGDAGCTPIDTPGPRWSAYVHKLRKAGVLIETVTEPHTGEFPGTHARYVLRSDINLVEDDTDQAA